LLGVIPGLERIERLLEIMGNPEKDLKCVHIAGTNGKGSTALIIDNILSQAGYRVGRFMSPHIHSYLERITVNRKNIEAQFFQAYLYDIQNKINIMQKEGFDHPTEFEVLTALAFQYFKDSNVDIAVLEVGMGGIYDSTNVVIPLVSVITSVDYEHTSFLGSTLEEIAANKAGIIKNNIPVVVGAMDGKALHVIEKKACLSNSPLYSSSLVKIVQKSPPDINGQTLDIRYVNNSLCGLCEVFFSLLGNYQLDNLCISLVVIQVLKNKGYKIYNDDIRKGLAYLNNPGRMEIICHKPQVIIDSAHNPHAAKALAVALERLFPDREKILICGLLDDKNVDDMLIPLGNKTRTCIVTKPDSPRGQNWLRVNKAWNRLYPDREVIIEENIRKAVKKGLSVVRDDEYILITGSFYILDQARRYFTTA